jgi:glycosyltransferase involved in cell wall biosynthesis
MRLVRRPLVFTCHEVIGARWPIVDPNRLRALLYRLVERVNVGMAYDRHIAVSRSTMKALLGIGIGRERMDVIYNGIDESFAVRPQRDGGFRRTLGIGPDEFLYLYFGRPGRPKGVEVLLRAVPAIQHRLPTSHLVLILAPEPAARYAELKGLIDRLGPGLNIHVQAPLPSRQDLARCLVDADCIVIPSITEGFGLTTVEACSLGVPVVATRAGAIPEVISGRHILVGPASASALAGGVVRAWRHDFDPWKPAPSFSWKQMATAYEACYQELLASCA